MWTTWKKIYLFISNRLFIKTHNIGSIIILKINKNVEKKFCSTLLMQTEHL